MLKTGILSVVLLISISAFEQKSNHQQPKLVIGIVVDQMRFDYLKKFNFLFGENGFKRLLQNGTNCTQTFIPYYPSVTACGHACISSGSVPSLHGINGNTFYDYNNARVAYCVEDDKVNTIGSTNEKAGKMSPANLWVTALADEIRFANNFKNKSYGISIKDRGAILMAGHSANGAFWYDSKSGNFISSSYYMSELPQWLTNFNNKKYVDSFYLQNWSLAKEINIYQQWADTDNNGYEQNPFNDKEPPIFPYNLSSFVGKDYGKINFTPHSNHLLTKLALELIKNEKLGQNSDLTDFLSVSYSAPDYIGHAFGPNSWEELDNYIRLDKEIENLLNNLDVTVGKNNYTLFLTADHGVAPIAEYNKKLKIPSDNLDDKELKTIILEYLNQQKIDARIIKEVSEYNIYFDLKLCDSIGLSLTEMEKNLNLYLQKYSWFLNATNIYQLENSLLPDDYKKILANSFNHQRSGQIIIIPKSGIIDNRSNKGTSHGVLFNYDRHIPLIFYGWGIKKGFVYNQKSFMTDIAPTISNLLQIQEPSGSVGTSLYQIFENQK